MMVVDMKRPGRRGPALEDDADRFWSEFNEVFFTDVFVPDDDVVGAVDQGWTVARADPGQREREPGRQRRITLLGGDMLFGPFDSHPERLGGGAGPSAPTRRRCRPWRPSGCAAPAGGLRRHE